MSCDHHYYSPLLGIDEFLVTTGRDAFWFMLLKMYYMFSDFRIQSQHKPCQRSWWKFFVLFTPLSVPLIVWSLFSFYCDWNLWHIFFCSFRKMMYLERSIRSLMSKILANLTIPRKMSKLQRGQDQNWRIRSSSATVQFFRTAAQNYLSYSFLLFHLS